MANLSLPGAEGYRSIYPDSHHARRRFPWLACGIALFVCLLFVFGASISRGVIAQYTVRSSFSSAVPKVLSRLDTQPSLHWQNSKNDISVGRRASFFMAGGLAGLFGFGNQEADAANRGVEIPGWQGQRVLIPNGIKTSPVTNALKMYTFPPEWPYIAEDFYRIDENDDGTFYDYPRFVTHIDDGAISSIRTYYEAVFNQAPQGEYSVLDMCSSWVSHYPKNLNAKRVAITGMNDAELKSNKQATDYSLKDLNKDPTLPYEANTFDFVTNVVSIDYINKPRQVVGEVHRVMKPGGMAIFSFSNRCFFTKAIQRWIRDMNDGPGHCRIVANYFRFSPEGGWKDISCVDISANPGWSDPMWVVSAVKA